MSSRVPAHSHPVLIPSNEIRGSHVTLSFLYVCFLTTLKVVAAVHRGGRVVLVGTIVVHAIDDVLHSFAWGRYGRVALELVGGWLGDGYD